MATLTINFQANVTGDHYVGYREIHMDAPNTYTVLTVSVLAPGNHQAVIPVEGSLYCGELHFGGYIIAACQDQADSNGDGVPDVAITWLQNVAEQVDPCVETVFTCVSVGISILNIDTAGTGYIIGDIISIVETNPGDQLTPAIVLVSGVVGAGEINNFDIIDEGLFLAAPTVDVTGSGNGDALMSVAEMAPCDAVPMASMTCLGVDVVGKANWTGYLGDEYQVCALNDVPALETLVGPSITVVPVGNCKCLGCELITIDTTAATTGAIIVSYNRCWDRDAGEVLVVRTYAFGQVITDIDCMIPESLSITSTLDVAPVVTYAPCTAP